MVNKFSFYFNKLLISGEGSHKDFEKYIPRKAGKAVLIGAPSFLDSAVGAEYEKLISGAGLNCRKFSIHGEPSPETVNPITMELSGDKPDVIISVGGGSVLDAGKAVSAMVPVDGNVEDYLEGIGTKEPDGRKVPFIAIPTTSGTGSEATMNGVISRPGPSGFKKSLRHPAYIPDAAVLDPLLTRSVPADVTAACGMDAFSQLLESYVSTKAGSVSDMMAEKGLQLFISSFDSLMEDLSNTELRNNIALAAYYSGLTLANAGLGIVHGLAGPIGGFSRMPHGRACGTLLYESFRISVQMVERDSKADKTGVFLKKLSGLGNFVAGKHLDAARGVDVFLEKLKSWEGYLSGSNLSDFDIESSGLEAIAGAGGNKNHPVEFSREQMIELLKSRL